MFSIGVAFRAFFKTLFNAEASARVDEALSEEGAETAATPPAIESKPEPPPKPVPPPKPKRSEAITLLAALQREARLVDFLQESLDDYADDQIGAAVRAIHRDSRSVLDRIFGLAPVVDAPESSATEVPDGFDAGRYHIVGTVSGAEGKTGTLVHHGWEATRCELPNWTGNDDSARVIFPAEIEVN